MTWEIVIGLEVHVELSTKTKIFCGCSTAFGGEPNSHTCPVCLGLPGSLPVLNEAAVNKAIAAGIALNCRINTESLFDRKNYFYPDLPKAYQISQLYHPICQEGHVQIETAAGTKNIRIHEIHMEEDAGKLVHEGGVSLIDYNRCGVPLIEIVSEPDLRGADEVASYLETLRETLVYLGVSDCKMQEGSMRADVNLSVRKAGSETYGTRTETKNMNSIKAIRRAIEFEAGRQIALLEAGQSILQETRRWDDATGENYAMRSKENAQDYRYFPDPDLVPLSVEKAWTVRIREAFPELAAAKRTRYCEAFGLSARTADVLTAEKPVAELFEQLVAALTGAVQIQRNSSLIGDEPALQRPPEAASAAMQTEAAVTALPILVAAEEAAKVVTGDILRLIRESGMEADALRLDASALATVIRMVREKKINRAAGRETIEAIFTSGVAPERYILENNLSLIGDDVGIFETAARVIAENPQSVQDFKAGKAKAFGFLVGQTMRAFDGKADPGAINDALKKLLECEPESTPEPKAIPEAVLPKSTTAAQAMPAASAAAAKPADKEPVETKGARASTPKASPLKNRTAAGQEPLAQSCRYRDMTCGELRPAHIGQSVRLAGWVQSIRDHGGIAFLDLRDQYGITQIACTDDQLAMLGKEYSISVKGAALARAPETYNRGIATGEVELKAEEIEILGPCRASLPFEIDDSRETREELRLKYRYLDLRNPKLKENLLLRTEVIKHLRHEMEEMGFLEIQTPILANSSPEGARDYLVPSRKHKGKFYALPQAPQQFKQLLMVSGFDRYFQIAPCFRDEDARLDRSPGEFYQLDFEMAYATQEDVFAVAERVLTTTFARFSDKQVSCAPYRRLTYAEAMLKYGSDKPDLRNPLEIIDLSDFFAEVDFAPFKNQTVRALRVPGAATQPRSFFRDMEKFATETVGMKGLGYISVQADGTYKGPIEKFLTDAQKTALKGLAALEAGDILYFISDAQKVAPGMAGKLRNEVGTRLGFTDTSRFELCFVTDYPMYEYNEETGGIDFTHNPFSMPQGEMDALLTQAPESILAWQYDIVCNGVELSSGAVRNHRPDIMVKAFEIAGYSERDVEQKFGALYSAFSYGAPPHAGMAPGVDRIVMLLAGEENIREIIAFPLNSNAQNLMLDAPSEVSEQQLREVHIKLR